jgi:oligopeptide transport system ATP-binding protein
MTMSVDSILEVKDLRISFSTHAGEVEAVRGVTFDLRNGETLAIVGESGSGKSVTAKSLMRLLPEANTRIRVGRPSSRGRISSSSPKRGCRGSGGRRSRWSSRTP